MAPPSITSSRLLAVPLLLARSAYSNSFGNYWDVSAPSLPNYIAVANSTLVLPDTPNPTVQEASLWVGMGMSNGDLVQSLAISQPGSDSDGGCSGLNGDWCVVASTLIDGNGYQSESSQHAVANPGDQVTMSYIYNEGTTQTDQFVYLNGDLVSTYQSSSGAHPQGWGTAEECQPGTPCGVMPQHQWINTVFVLNEADPDFGSTVGMNGASGSISTSDGGTTWYVSTITIDQYDFTTGQ